MCADNDKVGLSTIQIWVIASAIFIVTAILIPMATVMLKEEPKEQYSQCARDQWSDPTVAGATFGLAVAGFAFVLSVVVVSGLDAVLMAALVGASVVVVKVVDGPKLAEVLLDSLNDPLKKTSVKEKTTSDNDFVILFATVGTVLGAAVLAATEGALL